MFPKSEYDKQRIEFEAALSELLKSKYNVLPVAVLQQYANALLEVRRHKPHTWHNLERLQTLALASIDALQGYAPNQQRLAVLVAFLDQLQESAYLYLNGYEYTHIADVITNAQNNFGRFEQPYTYL